MLISFLDEILLPVYVNLSTNFKGLLLNVKMASPHLKHMNSILFVFKWKPMPLASCSRLCSRDLAWAGVFARDTKSFQKSTSVLVSGGYCRLFAFFFSVKTFSFIRSIDVPSTSFTQIINKYSANVSPCKTPATMLKMLVLPSGERTIAFVFL